MKDFQHKSNIIIVFALLTLCHQTGAQSEEENASSGFDFAHYNGESGDLKSDPFFSEIYHNHYDPLHTLAEIDSEPQYTYHIDHIDPYEVDIPEHTADATNQKAVIRDPRKSDEYDGDKQFFAFYNKYFQDKLNSEPTAEETEHREVDEYDEHGEHEDEGHDKDEEDHTLKKKNKKKNKNGKKKRFGKKKKDEKPEDKQIKPAVFEEEPNHASDEIQYRYTIDFSPSEEYERIKAISDKQREELKSSPDGCKTFTSDDGQKCYECYDVKTGDTSESCSYEEDPIPERYAYETKKSYDSKKDPPSDDDFEGDEEPKKKATKPSRKKSHKKVNKTKANKKSGNKKSEQLKVEPTEEAEEEEDDSNFDDYDTESTDDSLDDDNEAEVLQPYKHSFFFSAPQKTHEESKATESSYPYEPVYDSHSDVDAALKEFSTRDWSACEKRSKGDLTCYRCKDEKGVKHEECMFVQESRPKGVRVAYKPKQKTISTTPVTITTTYSPFKLSLTSVTPAVTTLKKIGYRATQATPYKQIKITPKHDDEPIINKKKSKKIVIVKRRKPDDDIDPVNKRSRSDDDVVEKRTIKRTIAVSVTGNGAMPANYTSSIIDTSMKKGNF